MFIERNGKILSFSKFLKALLPAFLTLSCASSPDIYKNIDLAVKNDNFEAAIAVITARQESKSPIYSQKNAIMLFMDKGLLEHYARNYANSSRDLQEAERLIEEAYTTSITANFASYIANDNTKDYPGEDFEDIYLNVFNALNYYNRGNIEGALVEIRKLSMSSGKLDMLARKYDYRDPNTGASLNETVLNETGVGVLPQGKPVDFSNSALARYLAALFYLGTGNTDSARIEFDQLQRAFETNRYIYRHPVPRAVEEAQTVPEGKARLNIISFTGLSPVKEPEIIQHYFPFFRHPVLHIANFRMPKLVQRPSIINRIEVVVDGMHRFDLELLEDMGAVIEETFAIRYSNILIKTYIRTILKYVAADMAATETIKRNGEFAGIIVALAAKRALEATEKADIRMSRYLPNKAHIGGINLDPGVYNVTVNFYSGRAVIAQVQRSNVAVREGNINLIDVVCLK
jgi:hypothetical protein